jgi:ectoine hydroxylase-related dioxygenase (phytanoyl-CoA dioxygenase family)
MPSQYVTVWIALDDCRQDNGCLLAVPGSHRMGVLPHIGAEPMVDATSWAFRGVRSLSLSSGSAVAFHPCLLHASEANTSSRPRRALMLRYQAADDS